MAYLTGLFPISVVLVLAVALSAACTRPPPQATAAAPLASAPAASSAPTTEAASPPRRSAALVHVGVEMRNLLLHVAEGVVLHYERQLVAGYSRNTPRKGLQVFMPDYARAASNRVMLKPQRLP
ncbi:MAG: hypothetical protein ABI818_09810 [Acidobacteriota bacterium]